jgi:NADPH-dependent ferric siderophore reductase
MLRVTLGGEGVATFAAGQQGGYVKLMLPPQPGSEKSIVRTYTIRNQRADAIDIDFALHGAGGGSAGPATEWASSVTAGEAIMVGGPGPAKPLPTGADWYIIAGDMTALPAISVSLENLPRDARGIAVIEIQHENDRQTIDAPAGIEIHWLTNPVPGSQPELLADTLRNLGWPEGRVYGAETAKFASIAPVCRQHLSRSAGRGALFFRKEPPPLRAPVVS